LARLSIKLITKTSSNCSNGFAMTGPEVQEEKGGSTNYESDQITELCNSCCEELQSISNILYGSTCNLVQQAGLCHKYEAYLASVIMCRGAVEALLCELANLTKVGRSYRFEYKDYVLVHVTQNYLGKKKRPATLYWLIEWARQDSLMSDAQAEMAHRIRKEGNFGAHLRQYIDSEINARVLRKKPVQKPYRLWVEPRRSMGCLRMTSKLVTAVAKRAQAIRSCDFEEKENQAPHLNFIFDS
jgi:hypothetical protein